MPVEREIDPAAIEVLRDAIGASGLSIREFADRVLVRDQRSVRRYLDGSRPIPAAVLSRCRELIAA